jgi:hypothetical protein
LRGRPKWLQGTKVALWGDCKASKLNKFQEWSMVTFLPPFPKAILWRG